MRRSIRYLLPVLLIAAMFVTARWARAQAAQPRQPTIISGANLGFRVDADATRRNGRLTGSWVVRVGGQWVEPAPALTPRRLAAR